MRQDNQKQQTSHLKPSVATDIQTKVMLPPYLNTGTPSFLQTPPTHIYSTNFRDNQDFLTDRPIFNDLHQQIMQLSKAQEAGQGLRLEQGGSFDEPVNGFDFQKQYITGKKSKITQDVSSLYRLSQSRQNQSPDLKDLMSNYKLKNEREVWDQISKDSIFKNNLRGQDYSEERHNNFMTPEETRRIQAIEKKTKAHFFDGQSKYIPLKLASHREAKPEQIVIIKNWLKTLTVEEKTLAMTIVDKDLYELFKAMYRVEYEQGQGGGQFCALVEECRDMYAPIDLVEMPQNFKNKLIYQKHSSNRSIKSQALRQKEEAVNTLVENIRLVQIRKPNTKSVEQSITVDVQMVQNFDFFMKIMKLIDEEFLMREYKIIKQTSVVGSLLYSKEEESKARQQPYFHVSDPQKPVYSCCIGTISGIAQVGLDNRTRNLEQNKISLAKCLLLSFEKALNLHFLDYQKKLAPNQHQQFFLKESEIDNNIFAQDAKLAKFWFDLGSTERNQLLEHTKEIERVVIQEHNSLKSKRCEMVTETDDEDEEALQYKQFLKQQREVDDQPQFLKARRKRKDRHRTDGSSNQTSSSGILSVGHATYNDYSQKQLLSHYGNLQYDSEDEESSFYDYESQKPVTKQAVQEELFSQENVDNCIFKARQRIASQGTQTSDMPSAIFFIKTLSLSKSLDVSLRESPQGEICMKSVRDMESALLKMFYDYLEQAFQKKINAELFDGTEVIEAPPKKKNKNKKKNKKKGQNAAATAEAAKIANQSGKKQQTPTEQLIQSQPVVQKQSEQQKLNELPEIKVNFQSLSLHQPPSPNKTNDSFVSSSEDFDRQSIKRKIKELSENQVQQIMQLNKMSRQIEHINTAEDILDSGGISPDGAGCDFLERLLLDREHDNAELLKTLSPFHLQMQSTKRYEEERTGLLSNIVHAEKYANEVEFSVERQKQKQRDQVLYSLNQEQHHPFPNYGSSDSEAELNHIQQQINSLGDDSEPKPIEQSQPCTSKPAQTDPQLITTQAKLQKKKKNRKKNKKKDQQTANLKQEQSTKQASLPVSNNTLKVAEILDEDVDEILQVEAEPEQKPVLVVRKQNFFNDNASQSNSNQSSKSSSHITHINNHQEQQPEGKNISRVEEISKSMTDRILGKAAKEASKPMPKKETKKGRKKAQQEANKIDEPKHNIRLLDPTQPHYTVEIGIMKEQKKPVSNFELDLSDKVKIPGRVKSMSSSGNQEELQHEQTLQELDSLFRSSDREFNSSSSGKLRSSTVDKSRKAGSANKNLEETKQSVQVSQFDLLDDLEDDIISHKMPNVRRHADDLVDDKIVSESSKVLIESAIQSVAVLKPAKLKEFQKVKNDVKEQAVVQIKGDLLPTEVPRQKINPERTQDHEIARPDLLTQNSKSINNQKLEPRVNQQQYQPKRSQNNNQQTNQNQQKNNKHQNNKQQNSQSSQQFKAVEKPNQSHLKQQQAQKDQSQVKARSQQVKTAKQSELSDQTTGAPKPAPQLPFGSWGDMFQTVYGAGISATTNTQVPAHLNSSVKLHPLNETLVTSAVVNQMKKASNQVAKTNESPSTPLIVQPEDQLAQEVNQTIGQVEQNEISHKIQSPDNKTTTVEAKLNKKQRKKQLDLAEQGTMVSPNQVPTNQVQSTDLLQSSQIKNTSYFKQKQKNYQEHYANSSYQTTQFQTHDSVSTVNMKFTNGMIQERGASTQILQNSLQTQQITNNLTYNIYPGGAIQMPQPNMPYQQQQQMQMQQPGQQYQQFGYNQQPTGGMYKYSNPKAQMPYQPHIMPPHPAYPFQQNQFNYPQFQQLESFFKFQHLSDQHNPYYEDRFHFEIGRQLDQLQHEIDNRLSEAEQARALCLELICKIARDTFPELSLSFDVYGSMATKLAIDTSDMDIAIYGIQPQARAQALQILHEKLKDSVSVQQNTLIATASVPIIKLELSFSGLSEDLKIAPLKIGKISSMKIDIVLNSQNGNEAHQTKRCAEFVKKQTALHPFLKPITLALKKYLTLKNLNSPFQGTMSSYGIVLLVLALLKDIARQQPNFEKQQHPLNSQINWTNLGQAFIHFFFVYGNSNQFSESVMINGKLEFQPAYQESVYPSQAHALCIEDPIDNSNNVGKQIYNFFSSVQDQLIVTFQVSVYHFEMLQKKMYEFDQVYSELQYESQQKQYNYNKSIENQNFLKDRQDLLNSEIQTALSQQLDRIIMMSLAGDLNPIVSDEVEELQRSNLQYQKSQISLQSLLMPTFSNTKPFFHPQNLGIFPLAQNNNDSTGPFQQQQLQPYQK